MKTIYTNEVHPTREMLLQILERAADNTQNDPVQAHVESCTVCQRQIENLAASPEFWRQASTLTGRDTLGDTVAALSDPGLSAFLSGSERQPGEGAGNADSADDIFPAHSLFSRPVHPEMLGRLGNYDIEYEIGRGGMGVVYKAFDADLNRPVAIKIMSPLLAGRGVARERFAREARAAAAILHPNVIAIYGVATTDKVPYLVMPYIKGPSIEQLVEEHGPVPEHDLVCFAMQMAAGLAAAHAQGVIHRDIKPANILIENGVGRVVITDFGLARAESEVSMTQTGWFAGTPAYMSPEQARGYEVDSRSDLFSLGSVMYYMATGRVPFRAEQPMAILERIRNENPPPAQQLNNRISTTLADLIEWLLEKNPDNRIQSAATLHQLLEQFLAHLHDPRGMQRPRFSTAGSRSRKRRLLRTAILSMTAVGLAAAAFMAWDQIRLRPRTVAGSQGSSTPGFSTQQVVQSRTMRLASQYGLLPWQSVVDEFTGLQETISVLVSKNDHCSEDIPEPRFGELDAGIAELENELSRMESELQQ
jgi:eukaryotic-like serine/threonine-protein kinase